MDSYRWKWSRGSIVKGEGRGNTRPFYMKQIIVSTILLVFSTLPFIHFKVAVPGESFPWLFFMSGCLAMYFQTLNVSLWVKAAVILCLINSFFSAAPLVSFISFFSFLACAYFFYLCTTIKNYSVIFKTLQAILLFNGFMFVMQAIGRDPLVNFESNTYFGMTGQHMQSASFTVILTAIMLQSSALNFLFALFAFIICNAAGGFLSTAAGFTVYYFNEIKTSRNIMLILVIVLVFATWFVYSGKIDSNMSLKGGRLGVWVNTFKLCWQKPLLGWGMGTYQYIFPAIGGMNTIPWKTAHNCWLQILFETGFVGLGIAVGYTGYLFSRLVSLTKRDIFKKQAVACLAGMAMVAVNMMFHFPTRMLQVVLLIIFFLAYCQKIINISQEKAVSDGEQ